MERLGNPGRFRYHGGMFEWLPVIFLSLLGAAVGSFLNVLVSRLGTAEPPLAGRSRCIHCRRVLRWYELIPLASFLLQGGRCRSCGQAIPFRYLVLELTLGVLFPLLWALDREPLGFPSVGHFLFYAFFASGALAIAAYDFEHLIIPRALLLPLAAVGLAVQILRTIHAGSPEMFALTLGTALAAYLGFLGLSVFSRGRAMGLGDAEVVGTIAFYLPQAKFLLGLMLAFFIGAIVGGTFALYRRASLKSQIPFAPFLFGGALLSLLWGDGIIGWYLTVFW